MIKAMAAIDDKRGIANDAGIPWDLPTDREQVHKAIAGQPVIMGYRTYLERKGPRSDAKSYVITRPDTKLADGFIPVTDVVQFLADYQNDKPNIWVMGGAKVYQELLAYIEELYLTRVNGDFGCTKFFPDFESSFDLQEQAPILEENGISFRFERWRQNS